jgi:gamma-glutamylcyclotransferase (GGCT)/AIG2-like uncharacterized protein YtfP
MVNLFTYGSLMCDDIMFAVVNCQLERSNAVLKGYYRTKVQNEEYPGIIPQSDSQVDGVLYLDLPEAAIEQLDVFEGEYYDRQGVQIYSEKFGETDAMTYVVKPQYCHLLTYTEWSFADFLEVGKQKFERAYFGFRDIQE